MSLHDDLTVALRNVYRAFTLTATVKKPKRSTVQPPPPPPPPRSIPYRDMIRLDWQHRAAMFGELTASTNVCGFSGENAFTGNKHCGQEGIKKPPAVIQDWLICSWFGSEKLDDKGKVMGEHSQYSWDTMAMARAQDIKYFKTYNHQRRYWREGVKPINCKAKSDNSITHGLSGNALIYDGRPYPLLG